MFYFGPWDRAGHFLHDEHGSTIWRGEGLIPWGEGEMDGRMQPHTCRPSERYCGCGSGPQGQALVHHKDGWTALAFWDRSVDTRGACCSVYLAEGAFTFAEMVTMAKERFAHRWDKMKFSVIESQQGANPR